MVAGAGFEPATFGLLSREGPGWQSSDLTENVRNGHQLVVVSCWLVVAPLSGCFRLLAEEREGQQSPVAEPHQGIPEARGVGAWRYRKIRDMDRRMSGRERPDRRICSSRRRATELPHELLLEIVARSRPKLRAPVVALTDRRRVSPGDLGGPGHRGEDSLEVQGGEARRMKLSQRGERFPAGPVDGCLNVRFTGRRVASAHGRRVPERAV